MIRNGKIPRNELLRMFRLVNSINMREVIYYTNIPYEKMSAFEKGHTDMSIFELEKLLKYYCISNADIVRIEEEIERENYSYQQAIMLILQLSLKNRNDMKLIKIKFGEILYILRKINNFSKSYVSEAIKMSCNTILAWESGQREITVSTLRKLLKTYKISIREFFIIEDILKKEKYSYQQAFLIILESWMNHNKTIEEA